MKNFGKIISLSENQSIKEKLFENFSFGLFLWQTLMFILLIVIVIAIVKLYKKLMKYLDKK